MPIRISASVGNHPCLVSMLHIHQFYAWYKQRTAWKAPLQLSQPLHSVWKIGLSKGVCQLSISTKQVCHYPLFAAILSTLCSMYFKQRIVKEVPLLCYVYRNAATMYVSYCSHDARTANHCLNVVEKRMGHKWELHNTSCSWRKGTLQDEMLSSIQEINPVVPAIIQLHYSDSKVCQSIGNQLISKYCAKKIFF